MLGLYLIENIIFKRGQEILDLYFSWSNFMLDRDGQDFVKEMCAEMMDVSRDEAKRILRRLGKLNLYFWILLYIFPAHLYDAWQVRLYWNDLNTYFQS